MDNKGFTLLELIIGMTVSVVVIAAITIFLSSGSKYYTAANAEISLQTEAQILYNQIGDRIARSNHVAAGGDTIVLYSIGEPGDADYYEKKRTELYLDRTEAKLYLTAYNAPGDETLAEKKLLGEYVKDLSVVPEEKEGRVSLTLDMEWQGSRETLEGVIKMRNRWKELPGAAP